MLDVGFSELALCAIVALVVVGPKDLPRLMRTVGQWTGKARAMSRHVRSGFDTMVREAEIDEMNKRWEKQNADIMAATRLDTYEDGWTPPAEATPAEPAALTADGIDVDARAPGIAPEVLAIDRRSARAERMGGIAMGGGGDEDEDMIDAPVAAPPAVAPPTPGAPTLSVPTVAPVAAEEDGEHVRDQDLFGAKRGLPPAPAVAPAAATP